jgi:thioredoxin-like negative regulator of GroEL
LEQPVEVAAVAGALRTVRPRLLLFHSPLSGRRRGVDGLLAQALQRRANHGTFALDRIAAEDHPEHEHFKIDAVPTLIVLDEGRVRSRIVDPSGCKAIERFLAPWLH